MTIKKVNIPPNSVLYQTDFDYSDSFQGLYLDQDEEVSSIELVKLFFKSIPTWARQMFNLRNKIVSIFGLKIPKNTTQSIDDFSGEPNERFGLFMVYSKNENEIVLGEDDKHLNFRVSLLKENTDKESGKKRLTISTTVVFNNWFGKLYFLPVKPFHRLIVPIMVKDVIKRIEGKKT